MFAQTDIDHVKYAIVGNSAGAVGAVEAIRQVDKEATIAIISDEPYAVYSRPSIAEYLMGERDEQQILYRPVEFYMKEGTFPLMDAKVGSIDFGFKKIRFEDTKRFTKDLGYDKLLLATGGTPFIPPIDGGDLKGIHSFITLDDAKGIKQEIDKVDRVVVIGGGLIGICVTEALVKLAKKVTIVELLDRVLNVNLDRPGSAFMAQRLKDKGVDVITNDSVSRLVAKKGDQDWVGGAELKTGKMLDLDMVIVAIGVRPRLDLVKDSPVKVNRGIVVDRHMETSVPGVYSCGDVAEAYDFVWDENRLSPIWPNAYMGGRTAGMNMAGRKVEYLGSTGMTSLSYFDLPIVSAGLNAIPKDEMGKHEDGDGTPRYEVLFRSRPEQGFYRKFVLKEGVIKGMIMINNIKGAGIITDLMRDKVDVSAFKQSLLNEEFGLAHLPKDMIPGRLRGEH
jgi:NAD(P)H-nitrite reductase large subunit